MVVGGGGGVKPSYLTRPVRSISLAFRKLKEWQEKDGIEWESAKKERLGACQLRY